MILITHLFPKVRTPKHLVRSMPKKSNFKRSFEKQHGKSAKTLLKYQGQLLYHIYWSLWKQLYYKKSLLVICKISRLFPNTLSADGKYSLLNRDNLRKAIQMQLSRKQKTFSEFFSAFLKASLNFNIFKEKKMTLIADIFPKLRTTKSLVRSILKKPVPRDPSERKMANATKHCWNLHGTTFTIYIDRCEGNWLSKSLC